MAPGTRTRRRDRAQLALTLAIVAMSAVAAPQALPGLVVEQVAAASAAAKAGFRPGDRVVSYDGRPLDSPATLQAAEENTFNRTEVLLQLVREGEALTLTAPAGRLGVQVRPSLSPAALALYEEGRAAQKSQKPEAAAGPWTVAARAAQDAGDVSGAAWLYGRVGEIREGLRQWKEAGEAHTRAVELLKNTRDAAALSRALVAVGRCSQNLSEFVAAARAFEEAAIVDAAAGHEMWEAGDRNSLAIVSFSQGNLVRAEEEFSRSLATRQRLAPDSLDVAASLNNLGNIANRRGDHVAAHDFHSRSLAIKQRLAPDSQTMAVSLQGLGDVAIRRGDLLAAEDYHSRALAIKERLVPDSISLATTLNQLGNVATLRGDLASARSLFSRALAIRERLLPGSIDVANGLTSLGEVAFQAQQIPEALHYHNAALAIRERVAPGSLYVAESLNRLGAIARRQGDLALAEEHHRRALAIQERLTPRALDVVDTLNNLGAAALQAGRFADAVPIFTRALGIVEDQRGQVPSSDGRALFLAQYTEPYAGLLRAHVALGELASAFGVVERARARSLLELLNGAGGEIRHGVNPGLLERERQIRGQLNASATRQMEMLRGQHTSDEAAAVDRDLDALVTQFREIQAEIQAASPQYAALTQPRPLALREVQQQVLDAESLLLEYALGDEVSYLFAVTRSSIRGIELPGRANIERAARRVYGLLTARQPVPGEGARQRQARIAKADAEYAEAAEALGRMILAPVGGELTGKRLLIVADGALQYVPFGALLENGRPLIVDHEIVNLPSASAMAVLRREVAARPAAEKLVAVLADPVFDTSDPRLKRGVRGQTASPAALLAADVQRTVRAAGIVDNRGALSRLPFTRDEADAIVAVAPVGQSTKAIDFNASRATATGAGLNRHRIVHLATHGVLDTERPELSGIVLSLVDEQGRAQDGFLRLHEVYNLNWAAELVVLSACQTALGQDIKGEGLVGLTRGFMYGGAKRVVASLWNVNDGATAQLMKHFYQGLLGRGQSPAAALRAAQIEMWKRRQWRSPYYWAAFVLQGEWR